MAATKEFLQGLIRALPLQIIQPGERLHAALQRRVRRDVFDLFALVPQIWRIIPEPIQDLCAATSAGGG
jgi:hypothetical protein